MTNDENMVESITYGEPIGKCDHTCLSWIFNCYTQGRRNRVVKYSFDKADFEKMRYVLGSNDWDFLLQSKSVNEQWTIISGEIKNKEQSRKKPPWMSHRVMAKIKRKQSTLEQFKLTRAGHEYTEYVKARNIAKNEIRRAV